MQIFLHITDWILWTLSAAAVAYLFVFALFSLRKRGFDFLDTKVRHRFTVLVPAYKEDNVIEATIEALLAQDYPQAYYDVVVIADKFQPAALARIGKLPVRLLPVDFKDSSKARSLNYAMQQLKDTPSDVVVILDADNLVKPDFLHELNKAFNSGATAIQAHRRAKNLNTDTAVLDAVSEEINNAIFRRGHVAAGISSALIGSGMAFDYTWFQEHVAKLSTAGEDKELEIMLLKEGIFIEYLDYVEVLDEKTQRQAAFYNQRRRWLAVQFQSLGMALRDLPGALLSGNLDYADKLIQWMMPPRILLLGFLTIAALAATFAWPAASVKWWLLLFVLLLALCIAIPDYLVTDRFKRALRRVPVLGLLMLLNLFRLRGAGKKFIHTRHGEVTEN